MRRSITAGVVVLIIIVFLSLSPSTSSNFKVKLTEAFAPLQNVVYVVLEALGSLSEEIGRVIRAARVNPQLEEKITFLSQEVIRLREVERENQELRALLRFTKESPYIGIPAQVIGRDIRNWYQSILIDKGMVDGVEKDAAVVSAQGVVGKVIEIAPHISRVLLIVDRNSRVGGVIQTSRLSGIVQGLSSSLCKINYLPRRLEIKPGELVLTSGLSRIYQPGLPIGTITKVYSEKNGLYQSADLEPAVDFDWLTHVMVLLKEAS